MCLGIVFQYCVLLQRVFCELLGWYQVYFVLLYRMHISNIARLVLDNFQCSQKQGQVGNGHKIASDFGQILGLKNTTRTGLLKKPVLSRQRFTSDLPNAICYHLNNCLPKCVSILHSKWFF